MAYEHKEFWIVVGTAAPVLLVSSVVAIGQAFDLAIDEGITSQPARVQIGRRLHVQPILKAAFASGVSVLADFVALLFALIDLAADKDVMPIAAGIVALAIAVVFLLVTLWFSLDARIRLRADLTDPVASSDSPQ